MYDLKKFFEKRQVKFYTHGKNVVNGNINIKCLFCSDTTNHLTIYPKSGYVKCWKCGYEGFKLIEIVKSIDHSNYFNAKKTLEKYSNSDILQIYEENDVSVDRKIIPPLLASFSLPIQYKNYIIKRDYDPLEIQKKYKVMAPSEYGDYPGRLIIPIIMDGKIVSYVCRDITGKQKIKYINHPNKKSLLPKSEWVYNIDSVSSDSIIIVEGVFDCWRIGDGCVALLSTEFSKAQIKRIKDKKIKRAFILFDNEEEAQKKAKKLESYLTFIEEVCYIELPYGCNDPDELTDDEVKFIRKEVFNN